MAGLSRRRFLTIGGGTIAAAVGSAAGLGALPAFGARRLRLGETYFESINLSDGVWAILGEGGNSVLATDADGAVLVDTKNAPFGRVLLEDAERLGVKRDRMTVVNTHHHGDHTAGNHAFRGVCPIVAHPLVRGRIAANMDWYGSMANAGMRQLRTMPVDKRDLAAPSIEEFVKSVGEMSPENWTPDRDAGEGGTVGSGRAAAALRHFGAGHTDNDLVVHFESRNMVHTGDLLFHNLHPYFDETAGFTCRGWIGSLWKIHALCDAETVVVPGHGDITDRTGVRAGIDYLEALWDEVSKAVDNGAKREDIEGKTWAFMEGKGFPQARARAIVNVYDEVTSLR